MAHSRTFACANRNLGEGMLDSNEQLEGTGEFLGEHLRFFRQAACAAPVRDLRGFARVLDEASDLGDQVRLCGIQIFPLRGPQILLRNAQTPVCLLLSNRGFLWR